MYHYLERCVDRDVLIYHFSPHGSKEIKNLTQLSHRDRNWFDWNTSILMIMHDQEPLNFNYYNKENLRKNMLPWFWQHDPLTARTAELIPKTLDILLEQNLGFISHGRSIFDKILICHSEKRSSNLELYEQHNAIGVYWWSHAIISRDWYRYAEYDPELNYPETYPIDFNIYNRAWAGSREYRVKFTDLIVDNDLVASSNIKFSPMCEDQHFSEYQYKNPRFKPVNDLSVLPTPLATSTYSADYNATDYQQCWIDVVLETLFDDSRLHLTEKTLRPIACGKPFILMATHGSLDYIKEYGFKTFNSVFDESYDLIVDPYQRMLAVINLMKSLASLTDKEKSNLNKEIASITAYNKQHFFSEEFSTRVIEEFKQNYKSAKQLANQYRKGQAWIQMNRLNCTNREIRKRLFSVNPKKPKEDIIKLLRLLKD